MKARITAFIILLAAVAGLCGCSDSEPQSLDISGTWYYGRITATDNYDYTQVDLARNGMFETTHMEMQPGWSDERISGTCGQWTVSDDNLLMVYPGVGTDAYSVLSAQTDGLELSLRGNVIRWYRSSLDLPKE